MEIVFFVILGFVAGIANAIFAGMLIAKHYMKNPQMIMRFIMKNATRGASNNGNNK